MAILDTLTIDGVAMDMHDPVFRSVNKSGLKITTVNTWTEMNRVTLTRKGVYLVYGWINFVAASSTGTTTHSIRLFREGAGSEMAGEAVIDATNASAYKCITGFIKVDTVPVDILLQGACSKTITTEFNSRIQTMHIIDMGG